MNRNRESGGAGCVGCCCRHPYIFTEASAGYRFLLCAGAVLVSKIAERAVHVFIERYIVVAELDIEQNIGRRICHSNFNQKQKIMKGRTLESQRSGSGEEYGKFCRKQLRYESWYNRWFHCPQRRA